MTYQTSWTEVARIYRSDPKYATTENLERQLMIIHDIKNFFKDVLQKPDDAWDLKEKQIHEELYKRNLAHHDLEKGYVPPEYDWQCCGMYLAKDQRCPVCGDSYDN